MNIFHLSECPEQAARWLADRHCVKMILESAQMLCTAFQLQNTDAPYRATHKNHPSAVWVRNSFDNFNWLVEHALVMADEYTARYGKRHKSLDIIEWCQDNVSKLSFDRFDLTKFAIAIADDCFCRTLPEFDESDPVNCYRLYYIHDKKHLHQWKRNRPEWINT